MTAAAGIAYLECLTPDTFASLRRHADKLVADATRVLRTNGIPASFAQAESMFNLHGLPSPASTYTELRRQDRELVRTLHLGLLNAGIQLTPSGMGSVSTVMDETHVEGFVDALRFVINRYLH